MDEILMDYFNMDTFTTDIIMVTIAMGKWLEWFTEFTMGKPNWSFSLRFW